jgi:uncharacterized protein YeaO (DUF488 family)
MSLDVRLKRIYEPPERTDGFRVLVERLWPRGVSRDSARIDDWARELAPSDDLRRWYAHDSDRFEEFLCRYVRELRSERARLSELRRRARSGTVTLVFAAREPRLTNASVLAFVLRGGLRSDR